MKAYKLYFLFKKRIPLQIIKFTSLLFILIIFTGCNKNDIKIKDNHLKNQNFKKISNILGPYVPGNYFDWGNAKFITFKGKQILLPWATGAASGTIPNEILTDIHKKDGWVLLYNTFNLSTTDPVFILYNKFSGIARVFMYVTNTYRPGSFTWGVKVSTYKSQTAAFNLNRNTPLPYSAKFSNPEIYNYNYSGGNSLISYALKPDNWYSTDVEFSYDPNLANLSDQNIYLTFAGFLTENVHYKLEGNIPANITGTFLMPVPNALAGSEDPSLGYLKFSTKSESIKWFENNISKQTISLLKTQLKDALTTFSTHISPSNILIKTIANGSVFTTSDSHGNISLDIKAKLSFQGTYVTVRPGPGISLFYPGTKTSDRGGLLPNYNKQLGVFYIDNKPVIVNTQSATRAGREYKVVNNLSIDPNSFQVVINPAVLKSCSKIKVLKQIVLTTYRNNASVTGTLIDSRDNKYKYLGLPASTMKFGYLAPRPAPLVEETPKVRITIVMTPIGRTDPILLIKEFDATLIRNSYHSAR